MSGTKSGQSRSGDDVDADGYHVEERAQSEEYHQTKDVRDDGDRTEIHIREGKVVKLEEVKTRETIRLASDDEVRALTFADFEGLDEIEAGTEVTLEEYIKKEVRHEKTVDGEPVIEISMSEERKSEEVKEDPQWKKDLSLFPDSENGIDASTSIEFDQGPITETVVVSSQASSFASPAVDVALTPGSLALSASGAADANVSIIRDPTDVKLETSAHGKPKRLNGLFGKKKSGKDQNKGKQSVAAAGAVDMEMETDGVDKENEVHDYSSSRRHEIKHKRHIIEEVVIEDSDKFYEKQEKRPKMFHKGTLERKKESPLETSHEAAFIETGSVELKPPNVSLHAESLPNISAAESVTYVVDYDQQASGSVYLEGHDDKSLSEKYKWYSFPRKRVTGKTPVSASKSLQKQSKTKSQEEIVIFDGPDVDKTDRKWGLKFGKWTGQTASIPETVSTEQVTFVVDNEPVGGVASTEHDLPVTSAETHTFVVQSEQANPSISGLAHPGKITVKEKHVVKADVEPETVTFVVEQDLPEMEVDQNKDEKHSLGLLGKIGGRAHEKDTSKTSLHSETVTYVVQTDFQKAELDNDKERSWGLSGKLGAPHSDKHTKKVHGEPETLTFVVEQDMPKAKVELNKSKEHSLSKIGGQLPEKHVSEPSIQSETVQFVVEQELQTAEVELQKDKERSWGLLGSIESQYPETSNKPTAESETVTFVIERDLPKADVKIGKEKEHSWSLSKLGKIGSQHPETHTNKPIAESETVTFVIEQDLPKADVKIDKEKEHSWSLPKLGKIGSQHPETHTNEPTAESETVTFVIEQDLPKADVKMDKEKEHSWSLPKLPIKSGKESRKPDESQVQGNIGARHRQQEVVVDEPHYYTEKNPAGKKGEAELQVQGNLPAEESLTITVQGEGDSGKVSLSGDDEKGKKSWSLKWPTSDKKELAKKKEKKEKKHRVQDEVIVDDAHLHMDEGKIKVRQGFGKQVKDSARVEIDANIEQPQGTAVKFTSPKKPDKQHLEGDETVTFIVEEKLPDVKLEYDGDKSGSWRPHGKVSSEAHAISENPESEVVTFVVEQDLPKGKVELEKEKKHSWSLSERVGGHLPERDINKPSAESETVTFVIEQDLPKADVKLDKEKEHSRSFLGMFGGQKPEEDRSKPAIGSESVTFVVEQDAPKIETERGQEMMHLTVDPIGKNEGSLSAKHKSKSISQPQSETVIFVIEQDLPKADVKLDKEKEHSRSFLGMFGGHKPEKDKSKPDIGSESVTFVVEQDVPKIETEAKVELGKDNEHSSSLLGRLGGLFPEKTSSKTSLEPESVTFVVEGQPISGGEGSISVSKPELKGEGKKRKQEERIADDTHLFSDESDIKLKPMKLTDIVRKKELQTPTQAESFTFVVTGEPEVTADLPTVSVTANGEEGMVIGPTQETVTFVVNEERPTAGEITDEKAKAEKSWTLPKFGWQNTDKKRDGDDTKHAEETVTFVVQNTGPEDAAKNDNSHPEGHVLFDKKVELRPTSGTISTSKKPKDSTQEEVVVDDTHLYSYKSELSWSPFGGKSKTGAKPSAGVEQPKVQSTADDTPQTTQETVTYTITREVAAPDQDSSSASDKGKGGKPHKWKIFGKKSPKGSEQSGSNISLPSSVGSKDASLPRRKKQEEVIVGSDQDFVPDSHGIITTGKRKPGAKKVKDGGPIDTTVYTFKVEPGVAIEPADITSTQVLHDVTVAVPDQRAEIQTPQLEVVVATPEEHAGIENPDQWVTVSSEAETATTRPVSQLKFDLGDVKFVDNVKEEYLESPEVKTIVDPLKRSLKSADRSRAEFHVNGIKDIRSTEHVEGSEVVSKDTAINFGTSTPKKDISTGAHGDEVRVTGSDHPFDVTVSSDTSINFVPQVGGGVYGGLDGSFEGSSITGSRPSSFYSVPANVGGSSGAPPPQHFVVIAIDFGTTFSGYAFSFSRDISSIHVMRKWQDGDPGVVNMKTPTVLLLTPEGKFHSFGFTAKDFYHNLNPKEATKWLYFEKFKMALHYNAVSRLLKIQSNERTRIFYRPSVCTVTRSPTLLCRRTNLYCNDAQSIGLQWRII